MTEPNVKLVICSPKRCDDCQYSQNGECSLLTSVGNESNLIVPLLVERERGMIYIPADQNSVPVHPPWSSMYWEQIWLNPSVARNWEPQEIFDAYTVGPYLIVFTKGDDEREVSSHIVPKLRSRLENALLDEMIARVPEFSSRTPSFLRFLTERFQYLQDEVCEEIEKSLPEISETTRGTIAEIVAHSSTALFPVIPLLLDDEVEEIFIDSPDSWAYFDHARLGRCKTDWFFPRSSIKAIMTLVRLESNHHLDRKNPSFKSRLGFLDLNLRVSVAVQPLCPDGFQMQIRRARKHILTIFHLIDNETISIEGAALLILAVHLRQNMVIAGAPGTGKTTLLNALDQITPSVWRKIYIEDAVESRAHQHQHQSRIQVDPVDEIGGTFDKSQEIVKSLHRSPDYVILGEIQTQEHSNALFHALSAGLRCANTCHSDSAASLISRLCVNHNIAKTSLAMLDLIVTMKRPEPGRSRRYVSEIVEVRREITDGSIEFRGLNQIYSKDSRGEILDRLLRDGAISLRSQEESIDDFESLYRNLVSTLRKMQPSSPDKSIEYLRSQSVSCFQPAELV
jgi:flagellar protein FlaI